MDDTPPALLEGRSALGWMKIAGLLFGVLPVLPVIVIGSMLPQPAKGIVMGACLLVSLTLCGVALWAALNAMYTALQERGAGYTTLYGTLGELWQLDPRTGDVPPPSRRAGGPRRPRDEP